MRCPGPRAGYNWVGSVLAVAGPVLAVGAVVGALLIGLRVDDVEVAVEMDVDLAAVVAGDLDFVVAFFVAYLGAGHAAAVGVV